jgi:hypothetical protein
MLVPQFPYTGSQAIVTSDRVTLYSRSDGVFLFGKGTVGLSSPSTINLDSREGVLIYSPKIQLGSRANEQVILGNSMVNDLRDIFTDLKNLCDSLARINETNFSATIPNIRSYSEKLSKRLNDKIISLPNNLSKVTYTE